MPGATAKAGSPRDGARRKVLLLTLAAALVVVAVAITTSELQRSADGQSAARQPVEVKSSQTAATSRWSITARAALVSEEGHTDIQARLVRRSDDASTPALNGNFDGSGGGEAELVTCATTTTKWTVSVGGTQTVTMACDQYVTPFAVHQLKYIYIDAQQ